MNKVACIAGGSAVCLTSASVGGYYMFTALDGEGHEQEQSRQEEVSNPITAVQKTSLMFDDLSAFKSQANANTEGIEGFFDGISDFANVDTSTTNPTTFNDFMTGLDEADSNARSYVRIEHQKKSSDGDSKWCGKFMWLWTFVSKDKGFITFNVMETTDEQKLTFKGVFYLLSRDTSGWKVSYKQEAQDKEIGKDSSTNPNDPRGKPFKLYFPNPKYSIKQLGIPENWEFMKWGEEDDAFKKMCACSDSANLAAGSVLSWTLEWKKDEYSGTATPSEWTDENRWGPYLYGPGVDWKESFKIKNLKGPWTRKDVDKAVTLPSS